MKYILGIDIGTTAVKAAVFDQTGHLCGNHTREYTLSTPFPLAVELDAQTYREAFRDAVVNAVKMSGADKAEIVSLGISAQGETLFCVGENGEPLRPAIVWMDNRAQAESDEIESVFGNDKIHQTTGQVSMCATWPAAKILWIKRHEPEVFRKTNKFLLIEDYFIYLLTGKYVSEDSLLCSTILWDINTREYWQEMLDLLEIHRDQLPDIYCPGTAVAPLTAEGAAFLGLESGMTVALGALDQACGAIGTGNVKPGIFSESTGAALATVAMTDRPVFDPAREMPCFASGIPGMYMIHSFSTGGMALRWYRDTFCAPEIEVERLGGPNAYNIIDQEVKGIAPGSDGLRVLPHLQGSGAPDSNSMAKGVFYGVTLQHTRAHFARAIMEGVAMVLYRMFEATIALGARPREIRSLSGGAKSPVWCSIKADATGVPVKTLKNAESAACLGAGILAGVAAGVWPSVAQAAEQFTEADREYLPNEANKAIYDKLIADYKKLFADLGSAFSSI